MNEIDVKRDRRNQIIEFVEREFIGPDPIDWEGHRQTNGEEILVTDPPRTRYIAGILYPRETQDANVAECEEDVPSQEESGKESAEEDRGEEPPKRDIGEKSEYLENAEELINRSNAYRQSAISITAAVKPCDRIHVKVSAGTYVTLTVTDPVTEKRQTTYPRTAIQWKNNDRPIELPNSENRLVKIPVDGTGLQFDITYRYTTDSCTVYTFTLENAKSKQSEGIKDDECFFQAKFKLFSESGFSPLPAGQRITEDEDYLSNQLMYRNIRNYAIGHGCAVLGMIQKQ